MRIRTTAEEDVVKANQILQTLAPNGKLTLVQKSSYAMEISDVGPWKIDEGVRELSQIFGRLEIFLSEKPKLEGPK